jgi:hypothetical protein
MSSLSGGQATKDDDESLSEKICRSESESSLLSLMSSLSVGTSKDDGASLNENIRRSESESSLLSLMSSSSSGGESFKTTTEESEIMEHQSVITPKIQTHYIFLVHGWLGSPLEMSFLESSLTDLLSQRQDFNQESTGSSVVVHSTADNDSKTTDGIVNGGMRLRDEVENFIIRHEKCIEEGDVNVSVSFVGNSLGGLYSRYAISCLADTLEVDADNSQQRTGKKIYIHPNVFCTTATPHLGCASNTFIPIPKLIETLIGNVLGDTGRDLFRLDKSRRSQRNKDKEKGGDLIYRMAMEPKFLRPLAQFRKRIAYANAFRTDFQVPTCTASFLSKESDVPHYLQDYQSSGQSNKSKTFQLATLTTRADPHLWQQNASERNDKNEHPIVLMTRNLDSLSWTKVFIDVRKEIPMASIPKPWAKNPRREWEAFLNQARKESQIVIQSKDLAELMTGSDSVNVPLGHTVMVANSKSKFYSRLNANGRPVMNQLAEELLVEIVSFRYL